MHRRQRHPQWVKSRHQKQRRVAVVVNNYTLFAGAAVVGAILTAFFWPYPSIGHHAVGISFPPDKAGSPQLSGSQSGGPPSSKSPTPKPQQGTCCSSGCHCLDTGHMTKGGVLKNIFGNNRQCTVGLGLPLGGCPCVGQPCRLPGDPVRNINKSNIDISPLQTGINRLLSGQNVFTGDPILGGARPLEAVP